MGHHCIKKNLKNVKKTFAAFAIYVMDKGNAFFFGQPPKIYFEKKHRD